MQILTDVLTSLSADELRRMPVPRLERVLAVRRELEHARVNSLDTVLLRLADWAPTKPEADLVDDMLTRAKRTVASVPPAQLEAVSDEIAAELCWVRIVDADAVTGRLAGDV